MNNIPELYDIIEYSLYHPSAKPVKIEEPIGWQDDLIELKRSTKNFTTVTKYSTNLEFVKSGAAFITQIYDTFGFEAKIILTKKRVHPVEQKVETRYTAILDGYTYQRKDSKVKVNAVESDLTSILKGYKSEKVELLRELAINGNEITPIQQFDATLEGKQIQLVSKWAIEEDQNPWRIPFTTSSGGNLREFVTFHMKQIANSDDQTADVTNPRLDNDSNDNPRSGTTQNMFYAIAQEDKTLDLSMDLSFEFKQGRYNSMRFTGFVLQLLTFYDDSVNGNSQYRFRRKQTLAFDEGVIRTDPDGKEVKALSYNGRFNVDLLKGESLALAIYAASQDGESVDVFYKKIDVQIVEDSLVEPSQSKVFLIHDAISQLIKIMTGDDSLQLVSNYFGRKELGYDQDGEGAYMAIASGFMLRQFQDKPLATTWGDMMDSLRAALNVSYVIEKDGFKEYVRVEPAEYFFNNDRFVLDRKVSRKDIKISVNEEFSISGITLGYKDGGDDYEEAVGLDEYNGQINWLTPLSRAGSQYEKEST